MKRVYKSVLEMNEYYISVGTNHPIYSYTDLISCSAIVFKGSSGYAGFHYAARGLISNCDQYTAEMKQMMNNIVQFIGNIEKVRCFTPVVDLNDCTINESYLDMDKIEKFFSTYNIKVEFADKLEKVSCEIDL